MTGATVKKGRRLWPSFLPLILSLIFFAFAASKPVRAEAEIPPLSTPVTDTAGMISPKAQAYLNQELSRLYGSGGSQLAILTIPTLKGEDIAAYAIRVAEKWKLGRAETDKGILLVISKEERKLRIEVGQGNEANLTDVQSARILDQVITPLFKQGDIDSGVIAGAASIISATDPDFVFSGEGTPRPKRVKKSSGSPLLPIIFFIVVFLILMAFDKGGPRGRGGLGGFAGGFIGGFGAGGGFGGSGGGGGGFGGFGGGGGGFSGGGASGEW